MNVVHDYNDIGGTLAGVIRNDDTLPLMEEGVRILSTTIDMTSPCNRLEIDVKGVATCSNGGIITLAVYLDESDSLHTWAVSAGPAIYANIAGGMMTDAVGRIGPAKVSIHIAMNDPDPSNVVTLGGRSGNVQWGDSSRVSLTVREIANNELSWCANQLTGALPVSVPGVVHSLVAEPNGLTPVLGDLLSHRYRHHTRVIEHCGKVWVAYSSHGKNEDASGMMSVVSWSSLPTVSFNPPIAAVPPQSTFNPDALAGGAYVSMPRGFHVIDGKLYLVSAIDFPSATNPNSRRGMALLACECKDDGTVGPVFRISTTAYTSQLGQIPPYDATLSPPLFAASCVAGGVGGSTIDLESTPPWQGWASQGGKTLVAPATITDPNDSQHLLRLWRLSTGGTTALKNDTLWISKSTDGGTTWGGIRRTDIPNSANCCATWLADGRIAVVATLQGPNRDPLYIALFDPASGALTSLYYVRQGLSPTPVYPGQFKSGAEAYPGIFEGETDIWVCYSNAKERIFVSRFPKATI